MRGRPRSKSLVGRAIGLLLGTKAIRWLPAMPAWLRRRYLARTAPWNLGSVQDLVEGDTAIRRDPDAEDLAARHEPLRDFRWVNHGQLKHARGYMWRVMLPFAAALARVRHREGAAAAEQASSDGATRRSSTHRERRALTDRVRGWAADLGINAIGIAAYDERYTFEDYAGDAWFPTMIVCVVEQHHERTQRIAGVAAERTAYATYVEACTLASALAARLRSCGYRAMAEEPAGRSIAIHYAVEAGLGQLGLNGQLLTPFAGSRCRLIMINTDASLLLDTPRDYGIEAICDDCQVCVQRCPVGAIPNQRAFHRGVYKAKINTGRCFPVVAQAHGCAVCMKVCPVQRYGLRAVKEHHARHGEVLGKGSAELESYRWPLDDRRYGPGERPSDAAALVGNPDLTLDDAGPDAPAERDRSRDSGLM